MMSPRHDHTLRHAPRDCPVCGDRLALTRLTCQECGTEVSGAFGACDFCGLGEEDRGILRVFLSSRGNMKDVERHLGVSYPTARSRFDTLLGRLGLRPDDAGDEESPPAPPRPKRPDRPDRPDRPERPDRLEVLEKLARGEVDVDAASDLIS